ncbi:MAG: hypothetical protein JST12_12040 [Armatimonadetes bacterium]|nr:hypothetical protein [Armatimonadota bacterium]
MAIVMLGYSVVAFGSFDFEASRFDRLTARPGVAKGADIFATATTFSILFCSLVGLVLAILTLRYLFDPRPGMIIDNEGFTFWKFNLIYTRIPWSNIQSIEHGQDVITRTILRPFSVDMFKTVSISYKVEPQKFSLFRRLNRMAGIGDQIIDYRFLQTTSLELANRMKERLEAATACESGPFRPYPRDFL